MSENWYYRLIGEDFGPVPVTTIVDLVVGGLLDRSDFVCHGDGGPWRPLDTFPEVTQQISAHESSADANAATQAPAAEADGIEYFQSLDELILDDSPGPAKVTPSAVSSTETSPPADRPAQTVSAPSGNAAADQVAKSGDSADQWFCRCRGREYGPFAFTQLLALAEERRLMPTDTVRRQQDAKWQVVSDVEGLSPAPPPAAPVPTPNDDPKTDQPQKKRSSDRKKKPKYSRAIQKAMEMANAAAPVETPSDADEAPATKAAALPEDEQWFYWRHGQDHGPHSEQEIRRMARTGHLAADVQVKRTPFGDWRRLGSVPEFATKQSEAVGGTAATAAPAKPATSYSPPSVAPVKRSLPKPSLPSVSFSMEPVIDWVKQNAKYLAVLPVLLLLPLALFVPWGDLFSADKANAEKFVAIARKVQQARQSGATDVSALKNEAHQELDELIAVYIETANAKQPYRQHMMWAGRDHMDDMFNNWSAEPTAAEKTFMQHIELAREALEIEGPPLAIPEAPNE